MRRRRILLIATGIAIAACSAQSQEGAPSTRSSSTSSSTTPTSATVAETTTTRAATTTAQTQPRHLGPHELEIEAFPVPAGSRPHDVAPGLDGGVWYTAQGSGELGWLDPDSGKTVHIQLGAASRPHGVIIDDGGMPWITDGGLNAIVSVDPSTQEVTVYPLPEDRPDVNLNTATFDGSGTLWFTGQGGVYGSLDPETAEMAVYDAPGGRGPYGITTTPGGDVFYASLAGSYIAAIGPDGVSIVHEPPTPDQGARRVWADSVGGVWVSEWNSGSLSRYEPETGQWNTWPLPGEAPAAYAVYVDEEDIVWVSDFGANAIVRFDPGEEAFTSYPLPHEPGEVRQILGRPGEVWAAESSADHLILIRTTS